MGTKQTWYDTLTAGTFPLISLLHRYITMHYDIVIEITLPANKVIPTITKVLKNSFYISYN